jgi:hypothetical protein
MRFHLLAILALIGLPVLAETPENAATAETLPVLTAMQWQTLLSCPAPRLASDSGESTTQSDCTATCLDGTTRTCTGTSCSARDTLCSTSFRQGYCWSNTEGYKYCNDTVGDCPSPCPGLSPLCWEIHGTSCTHGSVSCYDQISGCILTTCECVQGTYRCMY